MPIKPTAFVRTSFDVEMALRNRQPFTDRTGTIFSQVRSAHFDDLPGPIPAELSLKLRNGHLTSYTVYSYRTPIAVFSVDKKNEHAPLQLLWFNMRRYDDRIAAHQTLIRDIACSEYFAAA